MGGGNNMQKYGNLSPPPSPSPVKGEGIFDFLRDHHYFGFVERLKSNLKKSVEVFNGEEVFCGGPVPSLKHSRRPSFPKLT